MDRILAFDEIEPSWFDIIDDEISLLWENDEVEDRNDLDYPLEKYKHLKVFHKKEIHTK